jgi:hypothetical protein
MEEICSSETSVLRRFTRFTSKKTAFFIVIAVKTSNLAPLVRLVGNLLEVALFLKCRGSQLGRQVSLFCHNISGTFHNDLCRAAGIYVSMVHGFMLKNDDRIRIGSI